MAFAVINSDLSYWKKQSKPLFDDVLWNIPEQKTGHVSIIGGNSQNFSTVIRISEFMNQNFPIRTITTVLPDALRGKLPTLANLDFTPSTTSGSFAKSHALNIALNSPDACLLIGDLSRNSATAIAITDAIKSSFDNETSNFSPSAKTPTSPQDPSSFKPLIIARDSVDLLNPEGSSWLTRPQTFIIASMAQLQKLFRAIYYPRMIMLTQPLIPILETLHKFTLTYPVTILTLHQENIIVANAGQIITTNLHDTSYSPLSLWSGQLAARVLALNLFNPKHPLEATSTAILQN